MKKLLILSVLCSLSLLKASAKVPTGFVSITTPGTAVALPAGPVRSRARAPKPNRRRELPLSPAFDQAPSVGFVVGNTPLEEFGDDVAVIQAFRDPRFY